MVYTHFYLNSTLVRRTNGRSLGAFRQSIGKEKYFHLVFLSFFLSFFLLHALPTSVLKLLYRSNFFSLRLLLPKA